MNIWTVREENGGRRGEKRVSERGEKKGAGDGKGADEEGKEEMERMQ